MQRRDILFGALGIAMSGTAYANANQPGPKTRHAYTDYPALRGYVDSLRPIPGGKYETGHMALRSDEKPVQSVARSAFRMGLSPVTFGVWKEYCAATDTALPAAPLWGILGDHHVVNVSWIDIMGADGKTGFCAWASRVVGIRLTLPTEAQFEFAARGGLGDFECQWGNTYDDTRLWCSNQNTGSRSARVVRSNIFRNAYGLTDLVGNVWQWCSDLHCPFTTRSKNGPIVPGSSYDNTRCVWGGSWGTDDGQKSFRDANFRGGFTGFRLVAGPI